LLELCLRLGDSDPSRWREGDHDTAAGDSATAPSLAATRSRSTRSAASADPDPSASASPVTKTSRRSVCAVGAFAGEGFAEGARETLAETLAEPAAEPGMDDRADRNPSEAKLRDGDGFGEKAFSRYVSFARKAFTACALAPPPPPGPGRRAGDTPESFARFAGDPPGVLDAEVRADDRAEKNAGLSCFGGLAWNELLA
jgi:hypothetical protein